MIVSQEKIKEFIKEQHAIDGMVSIHDFELWLEEQPRVGEWIPCGKEKPRGGENIATVKWYDGTIEVVHAYYDGFDWITGCGERAEVIAWMPLPPVFKGE